MAKEIAGLDYRIQAMAGRIRELREIMNLSYADMALKTGITEEEYKLCEEGNADLNFAFLYRCALAFNVDVVEIIEGAAPKLQSYTVTRKGEGQLVDQAHGMEYFGLAASFKNRIANPLYVTATYRPDATDIELTTHEGQECDIVIKGALKVQVGTHIELLHEGDAIYYDSNTPHGLAAAEGEDCTFYAIVLTPGHNTATKVETTKTDAPVRGGKGGRIYHRFIHPTVDENGLLKELRFENDDQFNFAFDIVDGLAEKVPDKTALLHIDKDKNERRFSFKQISEASNQVANYFKSLGIRKGDRVMLVLKRHYQFWFAVLALHKLGAVVIPATNQLVQHDFEYRFNAAGVSAIVCTADGDTANQVDLAAAECKFLRNKFIVGGQREGWHDFNDEFPLYNNVFLRDEDSACGDDPMLMFFTSGTTGYPKMALHNFKYPLGHFATANYWHCVNPDGLHLTISDTGWAKSLWGKLYGQWLCEAGIFVYDFDRFNAADILPMFKKHNITTFCAPPTMYRMMIKQDLTQYDMSSIEHATIAGEALNPEVFRQWQKLTGLKVMEGFGQSESTVMIANLTGAPHKIGSMGRPVPGYDIDLVDADGNSVPTGENGEIVVRIDKGLPRGLATEYYRNLEKTAETWRDGLYHTGDLAWRDEDGFFWYVGRVDDVIKSSGYRIGPFEIENVIMELPYVLECGVSAAPDEVRGQVVKASIVLTKGTEPTEELKKEIQQYVKTHTAPYKYPRIVVFRDELPKTTSGKIIRNKL